MSERLSDERLQMVAEFDNGGWIATDTLLSLADAASMAREIVELRSRVVELDAAASNAIGEALTLRVTVDNRMRLVVIESPYAGDIEVNEAYARACMADCIARGEAPFASHLLYTQPGVLDDSVAHERDLGMQAGFAWGTRADAVVVYTDRGVSAGMRAGIERAAAVGLPVEYRSIWS